MARWFGREGHRFRDWYHYQVLDIPSMAFARGHQALTGAHIAAALGIPAETRDPLLHTGETGAEFNLAVYRSLMQR